MVVIVVTPMPTIPFSKEGIAVSGETRRPHAIETVSLGWCGSEMDTN